GDRREMTDSLVGSVPVRRIRQHASHAAQLGMRMRQFGVRLAGLKQRIDQGRARLRDATASRKAMELLKHRQRRQWQVRWRRRENLELDDLATGAFVRAAGEHAI
ncbi:MAG: flagellar FliJ family protein, partial [Phycisphaerae bacterium]|nr:flagellar FliJ family protein [Phycisphaerae bacterium]